MNAKAFKEMIENEYAVITEDDCVTQINTMEKVEYSALDMREDEISFNELAWMCQPTSKGFKGRKAYLSNDFIAPMEIKGHWFLTATHAICYYRCKYAEDSAKYEAGNPNSINDVYDAIRASKKDIVRANWNDIKERYCEAIVEAKFKQNPELIGYLVKEDGVFGTEDRILGSVLTKLMINFKAENEKSVRETGRSIY